MCSACRLIVFKVCVMFHENISSGFKVMEQTQELLTHKGFMKFHENMSSGFKVMELKRKLLTHKGQ